MEEKITETLERIVAVLRFFGKFKTADIISSLCVLMKTENIEYEADLIAYTEKRIMENEKE